MGDNFSNSNINAGQVGSGGRATGTSFGTVNQQPAENDAATGELVRQLELLVAAMKTEAKSPEADVAQENVENAVAAARAGKNSHVAAYLKSGGTWALGIAEKIGVSLAASTIKSSLGLPG